MTNITSTTINGIGVENVNALKDKALNYLEKHSGELIGAIVIFAAGFFAARWLGGLVLRWLSRKELGLEPPVRMLITRIVRLLIVAFALMIALGTLHVDITPLVAIIGVGGIGAGLAMQGVLSNVVAGLTIIFTKPFRVGEYISIIGVQGEVQTIELFTTNLIHPDKSRIVIPNRKIVGEVLHNYGHIRQLDMSVGVAYGTNLSQAIEVVKLVLQHNTRVLKEPEARVGVTMLNESSVTISVSPWVAVPDYGGAQAEIYQAIVEQFRANKIEIPFPQREVRLFNAAG